MVHRGAGTQGVVFVCLGNVDITLVSPEDVRGMATPEDR